MNSDNDQKQRKEKYRIRKCYWCKKSVKECNPECQCIICIFDEKFDSWKNDYPYTNKWFKKNIKFYDKLFRKGLAKETELANKWKHHQLDVLEKTGTNVLDWSADFEVIDGERKIIPNFPDDFQIITPYYDNIRKKTDFHYNYHCQICGKDILERYFIKHKEKKICIGIGIDCAIIFHYSDELTKNIKHDMDIIIKNEFYNLKPFLKKSIEKKLQTHPANEKLLLRSLKIITNHGRKNNHPPSPEKIAKLLLDLNKEGFKVFDNDKIVKVPVKPINLETDEKSNKLEEEKTDIIKTQNTSNIIKEKDVIDYKTIRDNILETMRILGGIYEDYVTEDQIIKKLQQHGISSDKTIDAISRMLNEKIIHPFMQGNYKISK